ncbi:hypothetical protein V8B97DRAFT_2023369 [Scleroderma yunnanense]
MRLADYALKWLEGYKYVHMLYFTRKGLHEAAKTVRQSDKTETLVITQVAEASKNMKLNYNLSFSEYMFAKNCFMSAIDAYNWFFHNLDNHQLCQKGDYGECTLVMYASQVCQDWHNRATQKEAYNLGLINKELLASIK